jgi:hypothetical protein
MIDYGNEKLNQIFNDTWPNLGWAKRMDCEPYPDEMFDEAARREQQVQENMRRAVELDNEIEEYRQKIDAGFKQDADGNWYRPELKELTRNERIDLAEKEIAYIVMGGQDGREYANSIAFLLQVLDSLRDD